MVREMTVQVHPMDGGLAVSGELDLATSEEFHNIAVSKIDGTREVVLDIADVEYIDSAGIRELLRLHRTSCPNGIVLRWPRDNILRVLDSLAVETIRGIRVERRS
jgi:anti-anti-sigma factor